MLHVCSDSLSSGGFDKDQASGEGLLRLPNGDVYQGMFQRGLRHGVGAQVYRSTGERYQGHWSEDKREGTVPYGTDVQLRCSVLISAGEGLLEYKDDPFGRKTYEGGW